MKLVGRYRFVVTGVDSGVNGKGNNMLKLTLDLTEEFVNDQWRMLPAAISKPYHMSLKTAPGKGGKSAAIVTAQKLKGAFNYTGGLTRLGDLVLAQGECVCEDHNDGNFTRIADIFAPGGGGQANTQLKEFSSDVLDEINKAFGSA